MADSSTRSNKRARVKRACDRCFSSKDKCDGNSPCSMCLKTKSHCTFDRPQQRRGPQAGMRGKFEAKIESLESMLGFMLDHFGSEVYQKLLPRLDLTGRIKADQAKASQTEEDQPSSPEEGEEKEAVDASNDIYPASKSKAQLASSWRSSDFAKKIAPGLKLELGDEDEKEEGGDKKKAAAKPSKPVKAASGAAGGGSQGGNSKGKDRTRTESVASSSFSLGDQSQKDEGNTQMGPPSFSMATGFAKPQPPSHEIYSGSSSAVASASSPLRIWEKPSLHQAPGSSYSPSNAGHPYASTSRQYLTPAKARTHINNQLLEHMITLPKELEDEMDNLLSAFFQHYHISTPFVDRAALLKWSSSMHGNKRFSHSVTAGEPTGTLALVLSICSLSAARSADANTRSADPNKVGEAEKVERLRLTALSEDCHARARGLFFCSENGSVLNTGSAHASPGGRADGAGDFEAIQCMLILAIVDIIQNRSTRAWIGLGMAIRLAQDMGIDKEERSVVETPGSSRAATPRPSSANQGAGSPGTGTLDLNMTDGAGDRQSSFQHQPSPLSNHANTSNQNQINRTAAQNRTKAQADQIRRLTWWTLFTYDSFLSSALGRPTALRRSEFQTLLPDPDSSDEEWALCTAHSPCALRPGESQELVIGPKGIGKTVKARMISTFVAQVGLSEILSELSSIVQAKVQPKVGESTVAQLHTIMARLHDWKNLLPAHLQDAIVASDTPTSLAGPNLPTSSAPPNVWSLALHYHFTFIIAQRALMGASFRERATALAPQSMDPLVDSTSIASLWDTSSVKSRRGDSSNSQSSGRVSSIGKSDFTSEHALPRLLARYVSAFGPASLPPTAAFYALASAHALRHSSASPEAQNAEGVAESQKAWDSLAWAVSSSVAWHPGLRQVAQILPIFSRAAAASSKAFARINSQSPNLNPNSALFNFNPNHPSPTSNGFNIFNQPDLLPYSMDSTSDEMNGVGGDALAYALGLPQTRGTPSSNQQFNFQGASPLQNVNYSANGGLTPFFGGSQTGTPVRSEEGDPLGKIFDMGALTADDQASVLHQLGLQPESGESRRGSFANLLPSSSFETQPIEGAQRLDLSWAEQATAWEPQPQPQTNSNQNHYPIPGLTPGSSHGGDHSGFSAPMWNPTEAGMNPSTPSMQSRSQRPGPPHHHISPHHQHQAHQHQMQIQVPPQMQHSNAHSNPNSHLMDAAHQHQSSSARSLVPNSMDPNQALGAYDLDMDEFGDVGDLLDKWAHRGSKVDAFSQNI